MRLGKVGVGAQKRFLRRACVDMRASPQGNGHTQVRDGIHVPLALSGARPFAFQLVRAVPWSAVLTSSCERAGKCGLKTPSRARQRGRKSAMRYLRTAVHSPYQNPLGVYFTAGDSFKKEVLSGPQA